MSILNTIERIAIANQREQNVAFDAAVSDLLEGLITVDDTLSRVTGAGRTAADLSAALTKAKDDAVRAVDLAEQNRRRAKDAVGIAEHNVEITEHNLASVRNNVEIPELQADLERAKHRLTDLKQSAVDADAAWRAAGERRGRILNALR